MVYCNYKNKYFGHLTLGGGGKAECFIEESCEAIFRELGDALYKVAKKTEDQQRTYGRPTEDQQ